MKSNIDKKFKSKGKLKLSSFKKIRITNDLIKRYKDKYPQLKHVRCKDTSEYICDGYIWLDNDKLVCNVGSCEYRDDHSKYIVSLEVSNEYRGYGLSKQLLDFAVNKMKCSKLSVSKSNTIAKKIYDDFGFKVFHEDDNMYYMEYDKLLNEAMNLLDNITNESSGTNGLMRRMAEEKYKDTRIGTSENDAYGHVVAAYDKMRKKNKHGISSDARASAMSGKSFVKTINEENSKKINPIHKKINSKVQNESTMDILDEAIDILDEGARYRKELKDSTGKSSNDYGKLAAKQYAKDGNGAGDLNKYMGKYNKIDYKARLSENDHNKLIKYNNNEMNDDEKANYIKSINREKMNKRINARVSQNEAVADNLLFEVIKVLDEATHKTGINNSAMRYKEAIMNNSKNDDIRKAYKKSIDTEQFAIDNSSGKTSVTDVKDAIGDPKELGNYLGYKHGLQSKEFVLSKSKESKNGVHNKINSKVQNESTMDILDEAIDILSESSGANGVGDRWSAELHKTGLNSLNNKIDEINKIKSKTRSKNKLSNMNKRLDTLNNLKKEYEKYADEDKNQAKNKQKEFMKIANKSGKAFAIDCGRYDTKKDKRNMEDIFELRKSERSNNEKNINHELHRKINKRVSQNESVIDSFIEETNNYLNDF